MDLVVMIGNASMSRGKQVLQCCICMHITASVLLKILLRIEIGQVKQPICLIFAHCVSPTITPELSSHSNVRWCRISLIQIFHRSLRNHLPCHPMHAYIRSTYR